MSQNAFLMWSRTQNYVSWLVEKFSYLDSNSQTHRVLSNGPKDLFRTALKFPYLKHLRNYKKFHWTNSTISLCHWTKLNWPVSKWHFNDCGALCKDTLTFHIPTPPPVTKSIFKPTTAIVDSHKEKEKYIKFGFLEKMVKLWSLRTRLEELWET